MPVYNFSAGPSLLPPEVINEIQSDLPYWRDHGISVMEIGHRDHVFRQLLDETKAHLKQLLAIPSNYHILFLCGGASTQFAMVPLNILNEKTQADYVMTGYWSQRAIVEAKRYCQVNVVASAVDSKPYRIPSSCHWQMSDDAAYLHYTSNATIYGLQFHDVPRVTLPLVADMSSDMLSHPIDMTQFGLIYACTQKNIGISGLTIVIVRDDLIANPSPLVPSVFCYQLQAKKNSTFNTPNVFAIYVTNLVLQWLIKQGGLTAIAEKNQRQAKKIYSVIDSDDFYTNPVVPQDRSYMNIPFFLPDDRLTNCFIAKAWRCGLLYLKGHHSTGGIRASLYNAMSQAGVEMLEDFMIEFKRRYG